MNSFKNQQNFIIDISERAFIGSFCQMKIGLRVLLNVKGVV